MGVGVVTGVTSVIRRRDGARTVFEIGTPLLVDMVDVDDMDVGWPWRGRFLPQREGVPQRDRVLVVSANGLDRRVSRARYRSRAVHSERNVAYVVITTCPNTIIRTQNQNLSGKDEGVPWRRRRRMRGEPERIHDTRSRHGQSGCSSRAALLPNAARPPVAPRSASLPNAACRPLHLRPPHSEHRPRNTPTPSQTHSSSQNQSQRSSQSQSQSQNQSSSSSSTQSSRQTQRRTGTRVN
jgi:hypothetical protein